MGTGYNAVSHGPLISTARVDILLYVLAAESKVIMSDQWQWYCNIVQFASSYEACSF